MPDQENYFLHRSETRLPTRTHTLESRLIITVKEITIAASLTQTNYSSHGKRKQRQ